MDFFIHQVCFLKKSDMLSVVIYCLLIMIEDNVFLPYSSYLKV